MKINSPVTNNEVQMDESKPIISKTDLKGQILSVNRAFLEISGFTNEELIGQPHNIVRHPDMPSAAFEDMWNHLKDGKPWRGMVKNRCKNGDYYWVEANATPVRKNGQVVEYMSVRRKPTLQQVSEAEMLYSKINTSGVPKQSFSQRMKKKMSSASLMSKYALMVFALFVPALMVSYGIELILPPMLAGLAAAVVSMLIVLAATAWFLSATITQPLVQLAGWMSNIAEGRYDSNISLNRDDEIGIMMKHMQTSQLRLGFEIEEIRYQAEQATRISKALEACNTNVMMADADCNIIYMNQSVQEMMKGVEDDLKKDLPHFNADKLLGENIDVFHKNPSHQRNMLASLTAPHKVKIQVGGRDFYLIATPVFDDTNTRLGTVIEWEDQTEMLIQQAEETRVANENLRIKQALDSVSTNAMIVGSTGSVLYCNDALMAMMNVAETDMRREIPEFHAHQLIGASIEVFDSHREFSLSFIDDLKKSYSCEVVMGGRTFEITMSPIINDQDEKVGTVIEWLDRTLEVGIEKEVDELVEAASSGDLSKRIGVDGKDGFFLNLARGLNNLVGVSDNVTKDTARVLGALAKGHLTEQISNEYQGDFDKLKVDANQTVNQLTEIITSIREAASTVSTGANEIAQGNADLSQRTEAQASNLEETASSMEEMTSAVKQTSDNAAHANELAASASELAETGGNVVNKAVSAMEEINQASSKIADIIGVIDEIAFQTNLLALNAAVEAARAGEQGRGFAVVAGEVRNLAQRSAGAAKEIKDLIRDSVDKVEAGTELVNNSGKTLEQIVGSVRKVTEMIAEISTASNEQSAGIDQVNNAVAQMDEMTQQNAALVEEATAAGEAMAEQSRSMMKLMDFFTTEERSAMASVVSGGLAAPAPVARVASQPAPAIQQSSSNLSISDTDDEWHEF